jgi:uncharacterized protein (TIGR02145 family)
MELKFGKKIWTAENLSVTNFVNGDSITIAKNAEEWKKLCDEKKPAGAYIDFKDSLTKDGVYYNIFALKDERGLIPDGWRLPSTKDWNSLTRAIGGKKNAGEAMKSRTGWDSYNSADPGTSNFEALASGYIEPSIDKPCFHFNMKMAFWWTFDYENEKFNSFWSKTYVSCWGTELYNAPTGRDDENNKLDYLGMNVRCVKDI